MDDFVANGIHDEVGKGAEVEFDHDVGAVNLGGVDADVEEGGDFLIGFAFGKELQDFALAGREAGAGSFGSVRRIGAIGGFGDARGEVGFVTAESFDGGEEDAVGFIFQNVTVGAGLDDLVNEFVGLMHGEDQDFGVRKGFVNAASDIYAIEQGHADIENQDVGFELQGFVHGFPAIGSLAANFPTFVRFEEGPEPGANDGVIIRDE